MKFADRTLNPHRGDLFHFVDEGLAASLPSASIPSDKLVAPLLFFSFYKTVHIFLLAYWKLIHSQPYFTETYKNGSLPSQPSD